MLTQSIALRRIRIMSQDKPQKSVPPKTRPASPHTSTGQASSSHKGPENKPASRPASAGEASSNSARPARPQAPVRPTAGPRLEGVLENQEMQSIESVIPSGLSMSTYLPQSKREAQFDPSRQARRRITFFQTLLPSAIVLCASGLFLACGWFFLDQDSVLRSNAMGKAIPFALLGLATTFAAAAFLLILQSRSLRRQLDAIAKN